MSDPERICNSRKLTWHYSLTLFKNWKMLSFQLGWKQTIKTFLQLLQCLFLLAGWNTNFFHITKSQTSSMNFEKLAIKFSPGFNLKKCQIIVNKKYFKLLNKSSVSKLAKNFHIVCKQMNRWNQCTD